jgi:hypothetical protein
MADNSTLPVSVGTEVFANDDIASVKYPRVKLTWGPDGTANDTDNATGKRIPVTIDASQLGALVAGGVPTVSGGFEYEAVPASTTAMLGSTGAVGDYIEGLICIVGTPATSLVQVKDGSGTAMDVLPNAVGAGVGTYYVPLGLLSTGVGWTVITLAGVKVIATGNFT